MSDPAPAYECPACGTPVPIQPDTAAPNSLIVCPQCGEQFFLPAPAIEEPPNDPTLHDPDDELDARRIRHQVHLVRELYGRRTFVVALAFTCAIGLAETARQAFSSHRAGKLSHRKTESLLIIALGCIAGLVIFVRRAFQYQQRINDSKLAQHQPEVEPDFSELDNGSKQARNLERLK